MCARGAAKTSQEEGSGVGKLGGGVGWDMSWAALVVGGVYHVVPGVLASGVVAVAIGTEVEVSEVSNETIGRDIRIQIQGSLV